MNDIFISYSSSDRPRVKPLVDALVQQGWSVWWDRTILAGKAFDRVIETALTGSRCVIVLWSRESVESDWVWSEADEGKRRGILVPAMLDDVNVPLGFRRIQTANLIGWSGALPSDQFSELARAVSDVLSGTTNLPSNATLEKEKQERLARAREEKEARERAEQERLERENRAETERERLEQEKQAQDQAEQKRLEREKQAQAQAEQERLEQEKKAREQAERERLAHEKQEAEVAKTRKVAEQRKRAEVTPWTKESERSRQHAKTEAAPGTSEAMAQHQQRTEAHRGGVAGFWAKHRTSSVTILSTIAVLIIFLAASRFESTVLRRWTGINRKVPPPQNHQEAEIVARPESANSRTGEETSVQSSAVAPRNNVAERAYSATKPSTSPPVPIKTIRTVIPANVPWKPMIESDYSCTFSLYSQEQESERDWFDHFQITVTQFDNAYDISVFAELNAKKLGMPVVPEKKGASSCSSDYADIKDVTLKVGGKTFLGVKSGNSGCTMNGTANEDQFWDFVKANGRLAVKKTLTILTTNESSELSVTTRPGEGKSVEIPLVNLQPTAKESTCKINVPPVLGNTVTSN